jgi:hypothetical protein
MSSFIYVTDDMSGDGPIHALIKKEDITSVWNKDKNISIFVKGEHGIYVECYETQEYAQIRLLYLNELL